MSGSSVIHFKAVTMKLKMGLVRGVMAIGMLAGLMGAGGCAISDKAVVAQAADAHTGIKPAVITDPELSAYMNEVGRRIIDAAREMHAMGYGPAAKGGEDAGWMFSEEMRFHLVNSDTLNAFTTGGNHMYIYSGLFLQCDSEDELAGVMAHEYGHVYGRHVHGGMARQYAILGTAAVAGAAGYVAGGDERGLEYAGYGASIGMLAGNFVGMKFSRDDETEADGIGFDFYVRAGWNPAHFADFFKRMIADGHAQADDTFSTHPAAVKRVESAERRARALPPAAEQWRRKPVAEAKAFAALQARCRQVGAAMPSDQTLEQAQKLLAAFPSCVAPEDGPDQLHAREQLAKDLQAAEAKKTSQREKKSPKKKK